MDDYWERRQRENESWNQLCAFNHEHPLKEGENVRVAQTLSPRHGQTGQVVYVYTNPFYLVAFDDGKGTQFRRDELESLAS